MFLFSYISQRPRRSFLLVWVYTARNCCLVCLWRGKPKGKNLGFPTFSRQPNRTIHGKKRKKIIIKCSVPYVRILIILIVFSTVVDQNIIFIHWLTESRVAVMILLWVGFPLVLFIYYLNFVGNICWVCSFVIFIFIFRFSGRETNARIWSCHIWHDSNRYEDSEFVLNITWHEHKYNMTRSHIKHKSE